MTEREWWSKYVRPAWHAPMKRVLAKKVEDKFKSGAADVDLCLYGIGAKCELKYSKAPDMPSVHDAFKLLSPAQRLELTEWVSAGGLAWVAVGHDVSRTASIWHARAVIHTDASAIPIIAYFGKKPPAGITAVPLDRVPSLMYHEAYHQLFQDRSMKPLVTHQDIKGNI